MEFKHAPVLFAETIEYLNIKPEGTYVDGTLGGGGHAGGICEKLNQKGILIGIDRDLDALAAAETRLATYTCQKNYIHSNYEDIDRILSQLSIGEIDGAVLDLGVSSFQLDNPARGFSYMQDAPLDMRMNEGDKLTAYDVVNGYGQGELAELIKRYGEERWAARIAAFIVKARAGAPLSSTFELVDVIKSAIPASARRDGPHPAKRTFQAVRIEVNDELGQLSRSIDKFIDRLAPQGRLCIITFHSLEDRIVKDLFQRRANPCTCPKDLPVCVCGKVSDIRKITGKPVLPGPQELTENPRARSAKLRVIEKRDMDYDSSRKMV